MIMSEEHNNAHITAELAPHGVAVRAVRLDDALGEFARSHGLKIDVEGHELSVLKGAERLIVDHHPWIVIEFNPRLGGQDRLDRWPPHRWLKERGYQPRLLFAPDQPVTAAAFRTSEYLNLIYR